MLGAPQKALISRTPSAANTTRSIHSVRSSRPSTRVMYKPSQQPEPYDKAIASLPDSVTKKLPMADGKLPPQHQEKQPGIESEMYPQPIYIREGYKGSDKLKGKVALITGGDSGIGRAVAVHFAREGADVGFVYRESWEDGDAQKTEELIQAEGRKSFSLRGDAGDPKVCKEAVKKAIDTFGKLDILVNNCGEQHRLPNFLDVEPEQIERTFRTNILSHMFMAREAIPHLLETKGCIINTASLVAYIGEPNMTDYAASKGAVVAFTRSLSENYVSKGLRVNAVAPGPVWTPVNVATVPKENISTELQHFVPMMRIGQPCEIAPTFVLLASDDGSFYSGQVLHPNGGKVING